MRHGFEVMAHPFFKNIHWPNLLHKIYSGLPKFQNNARHSTEYFAEKYKATRLSQSEISKIYNDFKSTGEVSPLEDWSFYDD